MFNLRFIIFEFYKPNQPDHLEIHGCFDRDKLKWSHKFKITCGSNGDKSVRGKRNFLNLSAVGVYCELLSDLRARARARASTGTGTGEKKRAHLTTARFSLANSTVYESVRLRAVAGLPTRPKPVSSLYSYNAINAGLSTPVEQSNRQVVKLLNVWSGTSDALIPILTS